MKTTFLFSLAASLLLYSVTLFAQAPGQRNFQGDMPKEAKVTGTVVDETSGQPIQYASVAVYRAKDSTLVTGALSNADGSFSIEALPYGKFYVLVTSVGYKKQKVNNVLLTPNQKTAALGPVKVTSTSVSMQAVEIVGSAPPVQNQIDKKVVDIAQNVTAAGGTLADALQNAPSVQTDAQGNVTLRGSSNYTVLIDGRPSPISGSEALQQIPANLVQSVEIITNPSAKYDAEGSSGIVNVIMKKQKVQGASGMLNATAGTGDKYNANLSLNYKLSKFNFTLGADFTDMKFAIKNFMSNTDTLSTAFFKNQVVNGNGNFHRQGKGIHGEIDYDIDSKNSLSLMGSVGDRSFSRPINSNYHDQYISPLSSIAFAPDYYYLNSSTPEFKRNYSTLTLDYALKLNDKGQKLSAEAYLSGGPDDNLSTLQQDTTDANWISLGKKKIIQESAQNSNETELRTKADYELPIGEKGKLEAGYQGTYSNSKGNAYVKNLIEGNFVEDSAQRDILKFRDQLQAGYVMFSNATSIVNYQLGLRTEYENRMLNEEILGKQYKVNRIDFFPSIHLSKQLPWKLELQASYTRRINRPREFNMNPFVIHLDPQNIRVGNPGLLPEFANSFELNLQKNLLKSSFISVQGFLRQTNNLIQQISTFDQGTQVTTTTFSNIDHDRSIGGEFMVYLEPVKWFNLNSSFNIYNYHLFGTPIPGVDNNANTWNIRINPTFHLTKQTTVQVNYSYNAPTITAQGRRSGFYFSTIALRQSFFKQKASLTLQARDLVGETNFINTTLTPHQFRYSRFTRESKVFMLTFSYRINNYRTRQNNRQNQEENNNNEDMNQGF